jgi:hypothetical protein
VGYDGLRWITVMVGKSGLELTVASQICGPSDVFLDIEGRCLPAVQDGNENASSPSVIATSVDTVDASVTCGRVHLLDF